MKEYILMLAGVIILSALVTCISPGGKMGKFVGGMTKLLALAVLVTPLVQIFKGDLPELTVSETFEDDAGYFAACSERLSQGDEAEVAAYIEKEYGLDSEIAVTRETVPPFSRKKIRILLDLQGINGTDERIYIMTRIQEAIQAEYGCTAEVM